MCDPKFAKNELGWSAKMDITSGLEKTIEYFKDKKHLVSNLPYML